MRIAFNIGLIISILYLPWWVGALVVLVGCFMIERFYEAFLYGMLTDALYGTSLGIHAFMYIASVYSLVVFSIAALLRDKLSWQ
jgi:cell shape-determining protein MreD